MRTLFDGKGKLHFWAVQRTANGLRILSRKTSQTDAFGRLRVAVFAFDLAVERIWVSSMTAPGTEVLNAAQLDLLNFLGDLASGKQFVEDDEGVQLIVSALYPLLERLQKTHPVLSQTGFRMLKGVLNDARADQSRARRDVELAFLHSWGENLKRIRHCSSDSPLNRDARRRQQLDDATSSFCDEISREFSFPEVFSETQGIIDWAQQDLIFQFQWMLWSCPVSSVLFGGKPLFQQVCSITNVISLSWMDQSVGHANASIKNDTKTILSAQWLSESDWRRPMRGLALLHESVLRSAEKFDWQVTGLADTPKASRDNLLACQNQEDPCSIIVVGGHGSSRSFGVQLADGPWIGDGMKFTPGQVLILAACGVGRLEQEDFSGIAGLYAHLAAGGCDTVVSAKWPIADTEASQVAAEFIHTVMENHAAGEFEKLFSKSRALNATKKKLFTLEHGPSLNLLSAFELYGVG